MSLQKYEHTIKYGQVTLSHVFCIQLHKYYTLANISEVQVVRWQAQLMPSTAEWSAIALSRRAVARAIIIVILGASDLMFARVFVSACTLARTRCLRLLSNFVAQEAHKTNSSSRCLCISRSPTRPILPAIIKALKTLFNGVMRKFSKCLRACHLQLSGCGCRWVR